MYDQFDAVYTQKGPQKYSTGISAGYAFYWNVPFGIEPPTAKSKPSPPDDAALSQFRFVYSPAKNLARALHSLP